MNADGQVRVGKAKLRTGESVVSGREDGLH